MFIVLIKENLEFGISKNQICMFNLHISEICEGEILSDQFQFTLDEFKEIYLPVPLVLCIEYFIMKIK